MAKDTINIIRLNDLLTKEFDSKETDIQSVVYKYIDTYWSDVLYKLTDQELVDEHYHLYPIIEKQLLEILEGDPTIKVTLDTKL